MKGAVIVRRVAVVLSILLCGAPAFGAVYFWQVELQFRRLEVRNPGMYNSFPAIETARELAVLACIMWVVVGSCWLVYWWTIRRTHIHQRLSEIKDPPA